MTPADPQCRHSNRDAPVPQDGSTLRFPAGRFEEWVLDVIVVLQLSLVAMAIFTFCFWFIAAPSDSGDWYLELLGFMFVQGLIAFLLLQLYE